MSAARSVRHLRGQTGPAPVGRLALLLAPLALCACAVEPAYPVRPGEPRAGGFEAPKPAYPITAPPDDGGPLPPRPASQPPPASPAASPDAPTYYRPQPITGAFPSSDEAGPNLRGHQSPGPPMPVRSAPPPALETPREVAVRPGESIFEVAERVRTPIRAIIDLNGLQPPYDVTPGQVLRIPPPVVYTVKSGDTLLSVARRFSIDPRSLANLNDISLETPLRPGQRLALPALVKDGQASARTAAAPAESATAFRPRTAPAAASNAPASATVPARAAVAAGPDAEPEPPPASVVAAAGKGRFVWPVKGDILSGFGPKGPGQRNDGVNISAEAGAPVHAAAAGQVVYAGNTIPGFGNLVVVKHPDGWTSLYGNLGKIAVKIRAEVAQGQELGVAGLSGAVDRPQVHFEVRYAPTPQEKARPVDPQGLLP